MAFTDFNKASLVAQMVKDLPTKQETRVQSLGREDPLEKGMTQFSSVQSLSHVQFFATPWTAAHQASLSITNSQSLLKLTSIESVMPSDHLTPCRPPPPLALNLSHPKAAWERLKAVQSFPILLLLLLSHFSRVPLCATP